MGKMLTPRKERPREEKTPRKLGKRKNTESESKDSEERAAKKRKVDAPTVKNRLLSPVPASPLVRVAPCGLPVPACSPRRRRKTSSRTDRRRGRRLCTTH